MLNVVCSGYLLNISCYVIEREIEVKRRKEFVFVILVIGDRFYFRFG